MLPDGGETYAPVGKLTTFRYLTNSAANYGLAIDHLDVVTAFLNPHVDDQELYMEIPNGWDSGDCDCGNGITAGAIVRLNKALYSLNQLPRLWYKDIDGFLRSLGFIQSHPDRNLYIYGAGPSRVCL